MKHITRRTKLRKWLGLALIASASISAAASARSLAFERISLSDGLSQSSVQTMVQGPEGYLWIGTQYGLDRYDGYSFRHWPADTESDHGLSHGFVRALRFDRDGMLWIGTGNGLNRLNPRSGQMHRYFVADDGHDWRTINFFEDSLVEDGAGNLLAATSIGPVRWNRAADRLEPVAITGAPTSYGRNRLLAGDAGGLWLADSDRLWRLDTEDDRFISILDLSDRIVPNHSTHRATSSIATALPAGGIAWATDAGLFLIGPGPEPGIRNLKPREFGMPGDRIDAVALDSHGHLWLLLSTRIARAGGPDWQQWETMLELPEGKSPDQARRSFNANDNGIDHRKPLDLAETRDGRVWLGGHFGVAVLDPGADRLELLTHDPDDPRSLPPTLGNIGYKLMADRFGVLWVGTNLGGLARLPPQTSRFKHVRDPRPRTGSRNIVRAIAEQRHEGSEWVWVSNQNAGLTVWRREPRGGYVRAADYAPYSGGLPEDTVRAMTVDPNDGAVWMAGDGWIARAGHPGARLEIQSAGSAGSTRAMMFDDDGNLWASATDQLVRLTLDAAGNIAERREFGLQPDDPAQRMHIFSLCFLSPERIVAGGFGGLAVVDAAGGAIRRLLPAGRAGEVAKNLIFDVHCGSDGSVWFGTRGAGLGRARLDGEKVEFEFIGTDQGLADDTVYAVLPGPENQLWLSSNRGVMRFDPESGRIDRFGIRDGLQEYEFSNTVAHIGASGRYYFGGINGWNVFRPESITPLPDPPIVHAESVRINGHEIPVEDHTGLELNHDQNRLAIEYTGIQFAAPEDIRYAYRLAGLDHQWFDAGRERQARYASLPAGKYTFELKAANADGVWSTPKPLFRATIKPPPWASPWAWAGYALALGAAIWAMHASHRRRQRRLQTVVDNRTADLRAQHTVIERQASELSDALEARTILFANISHEFRTPLTLIGAAFDKLERGPDPDALALGRRYVSRLLRLVEQLLDLSRLKLHRHQRSTQPWRLDRLVAQTVQAFESIAHHRRIELSADIDGQYQTRCPREVVEKILLNLLTNAIKYTPASGDVGVELCAAADGVELTVRDTGPGISAAEQRVIFERFYRTESAENNRSDGAGIGLALVKEAVEALDGTIRLASEPGLGSAFIVRLPAEPAGAVTFEDEDTLSGPDARRRRLDVDMLADMATPASAKPGDARPASASPEATAPEIPDATGDNDTSPAARGTIVVVEDNDDLRDWIASTLSEQWQVYQAPDGQTGLEQARKHAPDIIISDLMMPVLDGFGMLRALRGDIETSHIPVLMLTARQDDQTRLDAFTLSADAFLAKPFNIDELKARLDQIITSRQRLQDHLRRRPDPEPTEAARPGTATGEEPERVADTSSVPEPIPGDALTRRDSELLERVEAWLHDCYSNPKAGVDAMAEAACITQRTLQRKLKALTGQTPAQLLRARRLQCACAQLTDSDRPITEIAHACGFSSSQYFSRVFRDEIGQAPERWRKAQG